MYKDIKIRSYKTCDVLIIGAGGAGLRCASELLEQDRSLKIIAATKVSHPQKSHTSTAQGGLAAVDPKDPEDSTVFHMFDTWKGSDCTADQDVVKSVCESAWEQILWLENRGMHFSRNPDGHLSKRTFGGHTVNFGESSAYRAVFEADRTGKGIMDTSWGESLKRGIQFLNQCIAVELLVTDDHCSGAVLFMQKEGEFVEVQARAVVLATGGSGQVYQVTTNCRQNTGDGLALIMQSELPIMDPEAVQFHPTGIVGPGILASETLRSVGGILRNEAHEPFMVNYAPKMKELAPRDLVARAIESEIRNGRGIINPDHEIPHVWIDLRHLPDEVHDNEIPEVSGFFRRYVNLDPRKDLCPVRPSNHYHMGGIPTNRYGEVQTFDQQVIHGLYAIGECAASSFHGFNRLGTNSILELITMGKIAADRITAYLKEHSDSMPNHRNYRFREKFSQYFSNEGHENSGKLRRELRRMMTENVSVFRTENGLSDAVERIGEIEELSKKISLKGKYLRMNQELIERWELENLLQTSMAIAESAKRRKESRGAHFRDDYPDRRSEYNYHTLINTFNFKEIRFGKRDINMSLFESKMQDYEKFDYIERKY